MARKTYFNQGGRGTRIHYIITDEVINQSPRTMERMTAIRLESGEKKTSATEEDGGEDISHKGRWRGRNQPRRTVERKTSDMEEEGKEDISNGEEGEKDFSHGGKGRRRHWSLREMERKTSALEEEGEEDISH